MAGVQMDGAKEGEFPRDPRDPARAPDATGVARAPGATAPTSARSVREVPLEGPVPLFAHPEWREHFPWLCQGMTGAVASGGSPFDLRLFHGPAGEEGEGGARADIALRWRQLADGTDFARVVHARQLHGERITVHGATPEAPRPGLTLGPDGDGHLTDAPGILLTVATADCVPVSIVDPEQRVLGLLHAGWRGVVSGILEEGARSLSERFDVRMNRVHVHFGPSICGHCYEVGPEVFQGLGLPVPTRPSLLDLRATLFRRAVALGVARDRVTTSAFCTRCGGSPFFSHRGGDQGRQVAVLGLRSGP